MKTGRLGLLSTEYDGPAMSLKPPRRARTTTGRTIARPFGIELHVHSSWIISLVVLSYVGYQGVSAGGRETQSTSTRLILAVLFGLSIATCIVIHELAHSLVARAYKLPVKRITLFALGGVSQIEKEAASPGSEFAIALAGPLASVVLAAVLGGVEKALHPLHSGRLGFWGDLGWVNALLALFNLIPAFPMDGGRLLRSTLWAFGSRARATRWAVRVGRTFAVLAMGAGAVLVVAEPLLGANSGGSFGALWIILIGFFIYNAAGAAGRLEGSDHPNEGTGNGSGDGSAVMLPGVQTMPRPRADAWERR
jgi:Zn-dependent protease